MTDYLTLIELVDAGLLETSGVTFMNCGFEANQAKRIIWAVVSAISLTTIGCTAFQSLDPEPLTPDQRQAPYVDQEGELHGGTI